MVITLQLVVLLIERKNEDDNHSVFYIFLYVCRTCGGGVQTEERQCGGTRPDLCVGASKRFASCNLESCPRYTIKQLYNYSGTKPKICS